MKPYASKIIPMIGHPMTTRKKPAPNEIVPCTIRKQKSMRGSKIPIELPDLQLGTQNVWEEREREKRAKPCNFGVS